MTVNELEIGKYYIFEFDRTVWGTEWDCIGKVCSIEKDYFRGPHYFFRKDPYPDLDTRSSISIFEIDSVSNFRLATIEEINLMHAYFEWPLMEEEVESIEIDESIPNNSMLRKFLEK